MDYKSLSYRQKNRLLWIGGVILFVLCWFLSFGKTFHEIGKYRDLNRQLVATQQQDGRMYGIRDKTGKLDSLLRRYYRDSVVFEDHFLQNVSVRIDGLPVQLIYDGTGQGQHQSPKSAVLSKYILLQGKYTDVVRAIDRLEQEFFIKSISYEKEVFRVELAGVVQDR